MYVGGICGEFCMENWHGREVQRRMYGMTVLTTQFIIPMILMAGCYARIFMVIHRDMIVGNELYR